MGLLFWSCKLSDIFSLTSTIKESHFDVNKLYFLGTILLNLTSWRSTITFPIIAWIHLVPLVLNKENNVCIFPNFIVPWPLTSSQAGPSRDWSDEKASKSGVCYTSFLLSLSLQIIWVWKQNTILVWYLSIPSHFLYHLLFFKLFGNHIQYLILSSLSHYSNNSKLSHI